MKILILSTNQLLELDRTLGLESLWSEKRFVVHADEKLTAFAELEAAICEAQATCISST
jgi:hypothetical protein